MNIFPEHMFDDIWKQLFLTLIGKIIFKENILNAGENFENVHEKPQFWFLSWIWLISLSLNMINHIHLYRQNLLRHHKEVWKWKFKLISVSIQLSEMHVAGRAKVWTVGEKYRSDCKNISESMMRDLNGLGKPSSLGLRKWSEKHTA